jgi:putative hydroxymethylpyrimidine transport system substrate-binding protein
MFAETIARFAKRPAALDRGRYQRFAEFLKEKGILKEVPEVDSYAVEPR